MAYDLTIADVARLLGINYKTARELMASGQIESFNVGIGQRIHLRTSQEAIAAYRTRARVRTSDPVHLTKINPKQSGKI